MYLMPVDVDEEEAADPVVPDRLVRGVHTVTTRARSGLRLPHRPGEHLQMVEHVPFGGMAPGGAAVSVITPRGVERMAMPIPVRMCGISFTPTYLRRPGLDTRFSSRMTGCPPCAYFSTTRSNGRPSSVSSIR